MTLKSKIRTSNKLRQHIRNKIKVNFGLFNRSMSSSAPISIVFLPTDWLSAITILLSSTAGIFVVIYGMYNKIYQHVLGKMVLIVNAADLAFCLVSLSPRMYPPRGDLHCKIVQAIAHSTLIYSLLWGTFFGHALYTITKHQNILALQRSFSGYVKYSIIISLGLGIATFFTDYTQYSATQGLCVHLALPNVPDFTLIAFSQIPITLTCVMSFVWYIRAGTVIKKGSGITRMNNILTLLIYPGIVIFCWLPVNIVTTSVIFGRAVNPMVDEVTKHIYQLQGLLDALVYGIAPVMKKLCASKNHVEDESDLEEHSHEGMCSSLIVKSEDNENNLSQSLDSQAQL